MSILTLVENWDGNLKKTSFEAIAYGKKIAEKLDTKLFVLTFGKTDFDAIKSYGADKILNIPNASRALDVQITRLRNKIENNKKFPTYIQTVRGRGYVLKIE